MIFHYGAQLASVAQLWRVWHTRGARGRAPNASKWCTLDYYCSNHRDGAQWHAMACRSKYHDTPSVEHSADTVAPIKQAPRGMQWHAKGRLLGGYYNTCRAGARVACTMHISRGPCTYVHATTCTQRDMGAQNYERHFLGFLLVIL